MSKYNDKPDMGDIPEQDKPLLEYHSKLVGVTFEGRQDIIKVLNGTEELRVRREADNEYDPKAVAVDVLFGEEWAPIGYIAKDKNSDIAASLDAGEEVEITMGGVTGGGTRSYGVNIHLKYAKVEKVVPVKPQTETEAVETVVEKKRTSYERLQDAINEFAREMSSTKTMYASKLLGKSTEVSVVNGHVRLDGYMGGSSFPNQFYPEFDEEGILQAMVDKHFDDDKKEQAKKDILAMWGYNRDASTGYGTAIHAALENYDTFFRLGDKIKSVKVLKTKTNTGPNKALSKNPFLKKIVEDFHDKFGGDYIRLSEQFVWLHEKKFCGSIDRVKVVDAKKKIIRIQDFKTDGDIHEKKYQKTDSPFYPLTQGKDATMGKELLDLHWLQLSFYAYILKQYGYTIEGLDVYWLNPNKLIKGENPWEEFSHDVINIEGAL